jgi:hypothetical protein
VVVFSEKRRVFPMPKKALILLPAILPEDFLKKMAGKE